MCLLALFYRMVDDAAVIVGANREEQYSRGGEPPGLWEGEPGILAGVDPLRGGTWFGVNAHGLLVAVTNRPRSHNPPTPVSRGQLVHELLREPSAEAAAAKGASQLHRGNYAGCNLLCADQERAVVLHAGDWLRVRPLPPGIHVFASRDINDESDPRVAHAVAWLSARPYTDGYSVVAALKEVCSQTGDDGPPICLRGVDRGTVSSTLVVLRPSLARSLYLHSQGPPCESPYQDFSELLHRLEPPRPRLQLNHVPAPHASARALGTVLGEPPSAGLRPGGDDSSARYVERRSTCQ